MGSERAYGLGALGLLVKVQLDEENEEDGVGEVHPVDSLEEEEDEDERRTVIGGRTGRGELRTGAEVS